MEERIYLYPGGQTEPQWLAGFEYLRSCLSDAFATHAFLGGYWIEDFTGDASSGGSALLRASTPVPNIESDSWEAVVCWSGTRGKRARATAYVFPFLRGSAVQPSGRIADQGPDAEVNQVLVYQYEDGAFVYSGWHWEDGPGEWAHVAEPNSVYRFDLAIAAPTSPIEFGTPIYVALTNISLQPHEFPKDARISLVHANRNRVRTNLVPWTANPPSNTSRTIPLPANTVSDAANGISVRLDDLSIRGGWIPGRYHLTLRLQNCHLADHWSWSCELSKPFKVTVV